MDINAINLLLIHFEVRAIIVASHFLTWFTLAIPAKKIKLFCRNCAAYREASYKQLTYLFSLNVQLHVPGVWHQFNGDRQSLFMWIVDSIRELSVGSYRLPYAFKSITKHLTDSAIGFHLAGSSICPSDREQKSDSVFLLRSISLLLFERR